MINIFLVIQHQQEIAGCQGAPADDGIFLDKRDTFDLFRQASGRFVDQQDECARAEIARRVRSKYEGILGFG